MKKIIILSLIFFMGLVACGKKGDPVYKKSKNKIIKINKIT